MPRANGSAINTARPGNGRNIWTHEQRLCLWFIHQDNQNLPRRERARIFNSIYEVELVACGVHHGLSVRTLYAQYYEHRKAGAGWQAVLRPSHSTEEAHRRVEIKNKIAAVLNGHHHTHTGTPVIQRQPQLPHTPPPSSRAMSTASSSRKRSAPSMRAPNEQDDSDDDDILTRRPSKVARTVRVVIPVTPESERRVSAAPAQSSLSRFRFRENEKDQTSRVDLVPRTPKGTPARQKGQPRPGATEQLLRPGKPALWLKPGEYTETLPDLVEVEEELGKPHLPPLLFRYFDENSHGINTPDSPQGFICGRFKDAYVPVRPAPACTALEWNDLCWHLDHACHPSPFISTSNLLVWVISKALKLAKKGARSGRISVIDTHKLSRSNIYWVPPFHESLVKKRPFKIGGFNYKGNHEHLVWHQIPGNAVSKTFSLADIFSLEAEDTAVANMLRLAVVGMGRRNGLSCETLLKRDKMPLKENVATVAKLVESLGLDQASDARHLTYAVYQAIRGWELNVESCSEAQWRDQAGVFAHYFCRKSEVPVGFSDLSKLKAAFLSGVRWSMSKMRNIRYNPDLIDKMLRGAEKVNLRDASSIVMNELGAAMGVVHLMEESDTRDLESVRKLQPLKTLQTRARRQALLDYEASAEAEDRTLVSQNEPLTLTPTPSGRRVGVRDTRTRHSETLLKRAKISRAQLLLTNGVDDGDDDYAQPRPSRPRRSVRPARYEDTISLPKRTRNPRAQLAFTNAID